MICRKLGEHYRCNASQVDLHLPKTGTLCQAGSVDCTLVVADKRLYCIEQSGDATHSHQAQQEDIDSAGIAKLHAALLLCATKVVNDMLPF